MNTKKTSNLNGLLKPPIKNRLVEKDESIFVSAITNMSMYSPTIPMKSSNLFLIELILFSADLIWCSSAICADFLHLCCFCSYCKLLLHFL